MDKIISKYWDNRNTSSFNLEEKAKSSDNKAANQFSSKETKDASNMADIPYNFSIEFLQKLFKPNPNHPKFLRLTEKGIDVLSK